MSRKRLLVLAASTYQLDTIQTAKRMGYRVVTTDNTPSNPGHALADSSWRIDTTDAPHVIELARREQVDGVISPCTDIAVNTAAAVAEALGLPGVPRHAAKVLTDKLAFRAFLDQNDLPRPRAMRIGAVAVPDSSLFEGRRWIIKPNRASGSKGVFILGSIDDFRARVAESRGFSADGAAVLEEFLEGSQHTCEGTLVAGHLGFHLVTDRATAAPPFVATTGHSVPSRLGPAGRATLVDLIERIFTLLDVKDTVFDCDFVADGDRITIIEITPRLGGNSLSALIRASCGVDLVAYAIRQACNDAPEPLTQVDPLPTVNCILGVDRAGVLTYDLARVESLRNEPWVSQLQMDCAPGTRVGAFINGRHRVGEAILRGPTRDDLDALPVWLRSQLRLAAEPIPA